MTDDPIAVNHRALIAAADKLARAGYDGDAYRFIEGLIVSVLADGYRPVEKPPALRGTGTNGRAAIDAAKAAAAEAVSAARARRTAKEGT